MEREWMKRVTGFLKLGKGIAETLKCLGKLNPKPRVRKPKS